MNFYKKVYRAISCYIPHCKFIGVSSTRSNIWVSACRKENLSSSGKWYLFACKSSYILNAGEE